MHSKSQLNIRSPVTASSDRKETETGEFLSSSSFSDRKTVMLSDKRIGPPLVRSALLLRCCAVALLRRRGTAQAADTLASPSAVTRKKCSNKIVWHEVVKRRRNQLQPIYLFYDCLSLRSRTKTVQLKRLPLPLPGHRRSPLPPSLQLLLVAKLARTENTAWRIWQAYNATHTPSCQLSWCRSTHTHVQQCTGLQCLCRVNRVCVS